MGIILEYNRIFSCPGQSFQVTVGWLENIANKLQQSDIAEVALFRFLYDKYESEIEICPLMHEPRDFHGLSYIAKIKNQLHMTGFYYDIYGKLEINHIEKFEKLYLQNMGSMGWDKYEKNAKLYLLFRGLTKH